MTHTHVGYRPGRSRRVGTRYASDFYGDGAEPRNGKRHALNRDGRDYLALCGERVPAEAGNESDIDGPTTGHVRPAGEFRVTCKRCLVKM